VAVEELILEKPQKVTFKKGVWNTSINLRDFVVKKHYIVLWR
jgi:formate C-acetyltransferase